MFGPDGRPWAPAADHGPVGACGNVRIYPAGTSLPLVSTVNYATGQTRANNTIAVLNALGQVAERCSQPSGTVHVVLDVNGCFE